MASASSATSSPGSSESKNLALSYAGPSIDATQPCSVMCTLDMLLRCLACQFAKSSALFAAFAARALASWGFRYILYADPEA